ncbi:MAG: hypothetical protein H0T76_15390 [Nannocystis sp.]|nr:hypothetical protein [Nannocystis sp.]MBA3547866.1 hypothetical protein [Nannocystis sp.]
MARAGTELRRWALLGLGLTGMVFAGSGLVLQDSARAEPFRVEVAAPGAVAASSLALRWTGRVKPGELAGRVQAKVDGVVVAASVDGEAVALDLGAAGPGVHLIELELRQQGGRTQTVTDTLLVGPFAAVDAPVLEDRIKEADLSTCGLSLTIAESAIQRLLVPPLRERLLGAAQASPLLGPDTVLEQAELTLLRDVMRVRITLAGLNRVGVDAFVIALPRGPRGLELSLLRLGPVEFSGQLRTRATMGGAAIGAAVTGPLAPLGALGGWWVTDRYIERRARREVHEQLETGLAQASSLPLLPEQAELVIGEPRSAVALQFCGPVTIEAGTGIATRLALRSLAPGDGPGPGPVRRGVVLESGPVLGDMSGETADVQLDLSIDAVNALLHAWTDNGLLGDLAAGAGWVPQVDAELQAWTRLHFAGLKIVRAPVLMAADQGVSAPGEPAWALSFGGLRLDLRGGEAVGDLVVAGRGWVRPRFDAASGRLELGGMVDRLRLGCVDGVVLTPCFGALLELGEVERRLDALLAPGTGRLPAIDVRALLRTRTRELRAEGLDVEALRLEVPAGQPGVLRVRARLR